MRVSHQPNRRCLSSAIALLALGLSLTSCGQQASNPAPSSTPVAMSPISVSPPAASPATSPTPKPVAASPDPLVRVSQPVSPAAPPKTQALVTQTTKGTDPKRVEFAAGTTSALLKNAVVRGDRDIYLLGAQVGQRMTVTVTALEDNAAFDVIAPDGSMIQQEATHWADTLPATGDYQIVVGGTRGNATYELQVAIR